MGIWWGVVGWDGWMDGGMGGDGRGGEGMGAMEVCRYLR